MACVADVQLLTVESTHDAYALAQALNCTGGGSFEVEWKGRVTLNDTISISNGTALSVLGYEGSVIDGESALQLFEVEAATLYLSGLELGNGSTETSGGAVSLTSASNLTVVNCTISSNSAEVSGGAILAEDGSLLSLEGTNMFDSNDAVDYGGAVLIDDSSTLLISGVSTFVDNYANYGGGLALLDYSLFNVTGEVHFTNNTASVNGAGIYSYSSAFLLSDPRENATSTFSGNSAEELAGALYWSGSDVELQLLRAVFTGNTAESGGAMYLARGDNVQIDSTRFKSNVAQIDGGAVVARSLGGRGDFAELTNLTFEDNVAGSNGGAMVVEDGSVRLVDSLLTRNWAGDE